jgi:hypothetical protein
MIHRVFPSMLALATPAAMAAGEPQVMMGRITIHERIVVRVPRAQAVYPVGRAPVVPLPSWKESKGPKCVGVSDLAAAAVVVPAAVDLMMVDGRRMRARLDRDCRSADFYSGLYLRPGGDGRLCADRDSIRVRSGATCAIRDFRLVTIEPPRGR